MTYQKHVSWLKISCHVHYTGLWECPSHHDLKSDLQTLSSRVPQLWSAGNHAFRQQVRKQCAELWSYFEVKSQIFLCCTLSFHRRNWRLLLWGLESSFAKGHCILELARNPVFCAIAANSSHNCGRFFYFIFSCSGVKKNNQYFSLKFSCTNIVVSLLSPSLVACIHLFPGIFLYTI